MSLQSVLKKGWWGSIFFVVWVCVALALGARGYWELYAAKASGDEAAGALVLNVASSALALFLGGGSGNEGGLWLAVARAMAILTSFAAIVLAAWALWRWPLSHHFKLHWAWPLREPRGKQYLICGLGELGYALAENLCEEEAKLRVVAIESNPANPNIERLRNKGAVVIEGNATDIDVLRKAQLSKASHVIMLTGSDAINLEILAAVKEDEKTRERGAGNRLRCHVHLYNRENRIPFEVGGRHWPPVTDGLEISLLNVFESVAQRLFQDHPLGSNADTVEPGAEPVRVLISGFGRMGEAVLVETMLLGHFCNHVPIQITILDDDAERKRENFYRRHWEVKNHLDYWGLRLWRLEFVKDLAESRLAKSLTDYTDILACHDSEDEALTAIHQLWDRHRQRDNRRSTRFFVHAPSGRDITNSKIETFGPRRQTCCKSFVIDDELEQVARKTNLMYAKLKSGSRDDDQDFERKLQSDDANRDQDKKLHWDNFTLLKKASNKTEKRHMKIKTAALGLEECEEGEEPPEEVIKFNELLQGPAKDALDKFGEESIESANRMLTLASHGKGMNQITVIKRLNDLAETEKARWNAFYVVNNFILGKKSESELSHDCLMSWGDINNLNDNDARKSVINYDYKNVYQIREVLRHFGKGVRPIASENKNT